MFYRGFVTSRSYSLSFLSLGRPVLSVMTPKTTPCATLLWQCKSLKITLHDTLFDPPCHFQLFQRSNEKEISMSHHFLLPLQFLFITFSCPISYSLPTNFLFISFNLGHAPNPAGSSLWVSYEKNMKQTIRLRPKIQECKGPPQKRGSEVVNKIWDSHA